MTKFVLIPGAWLGGWAWKTVTPLLEAAGHSAIPVTLTGMGERVHLAGEHVGMSTAVSDVLNVLRYEEIGDCVLVGHSFAGKVAAAAADQSPHPIHRVIYVDAFRPERTTEPQGGFDPTREFGALPPGATGVPLTAKIIDNIGPDVTGRAREHMLALATPWPTNLAKDPISLSKRYDAVSESYILCSKSGDPVDEIVAGKWGKLDGPHRILATGHWPMLTDPEGLARALVELAAAPKSG